MEQRERQQIQAGEQERAQNERDFHGELAKWGERISLAIFVSLVIQGLIVGTSLQQVFIGLFMAGISYYYSLKQLKASKPF